MEKLAAYEDEIRILQSRIYHANQNHIHSPPSATLSSPTTIMQTDKQLPSPPREPNSQSPPKTPSTQTRFNAIASFLPYGRRTPPAQSTQRFSPNQLGTDADANLQDALSKETALRKAAESRLTQANSELEDLTAQLFSQANEMVAEERRARAKLEERVEVLEKRDGEKRRRLERLEKAIERVERVRGLVGS